MAERSVETEVQKAKPSAITYVKAYNFANILFLESPVPPALLATLIAAQHLRPPQFLPLIFPPVLLFSTYLNLYNFKIDAAGISAAWSGLYLILTQRRKQNLRQKWG